MTANQIAYYKAKEERRSHMASESIGQESNRINLIKSGIDAQNAATNQYLANVRNFEAMETVRANQAREYETMRHNIATENELLRSNTAREAISNLEYAETVRSNRAREQENMRANLANEMLKSQSTQVDLYRAQETQRANMASESQREAQLWHDASRMKTEQFQAHEQARHNQAVEQETAYKDSRTLNQGAFKEVVNFASKLLGPLVGFLAA